MWKMSRTGVGMRVALLGMVMALSLAVTAVAQDRSAGRVLDDAKISLSVKAKLVADKPANITRLDVKVMNGIVTLDGIVDTDEARARAEELARSVEGVQQVVNQVRVAAPPPASPR